MLLFLSSETSYTKQRHTQIKIFNPVSFFMQMGRKTSPHNYKCFTEVLNIYHFVEGKVETAKYEFEFQICVGKN